MKVILKMIYMKEKGKKYLMMVVNMKEIFMRVIGMEKEL